jgi:hypothetical protein
MAEDDWSNFEAGEDDEEEAALPSLHEVLRSLALVGDDHYIGMQATNLAIVDSMIEPLEDELAAEYSFTERLPIDKFLPVSALSQLWIFGVYEFLRTWRQWIVDVLRRSDALARLNANEQRRRLEDELAELRRESQECPGGVPYSRGFERAAVDAEYRDSLRDALYRSDLAFRRIESVRLHLAKHEVPKTDKQYGAGAGYARIDIDRSIQFHIPLGKYEVTSISRRSIVRDLRRMGDGRPLFVISEALQKAVAKLPHSSYGIHRVRMVLEDGTVYEGAIAWKRHVVWVKGLPMPPFDVARIATIELAPED